VTLSIRIEAIRLPLVSVLATGHGAIRHRKSLLLALDDGEHVGWGEASPLPGWSTGSLVETERALRASLEGVRGDDDIADAIASLHEHQHARAAVSGAWADLGARRDDLPLAASLSGRWRADVAVNALLGGADRETLETEAAVAVASGFTTVKLKVGASAPATDIERIRAVRRTAPDVSLRLDANQGWDRTTAIDVLSQVVEEDVAWCEEPTRFLDEFGSIESATGVPVAVDESIATATELRRALAMGLSVVIIKPQAVGGPDRAAISAELAADSGATVVFTSFMDSAVGVSHALHVASAFGGPVAHGLVTTGLLGADVGPSPAVEDGQMLVSTSPGIGFHPQIS
jgi:o-succinylbenzoate synthase